MQKTRQDIGREKRRLGRTIELQEMMRVVSTGEDMDTDALIGKLMLLLSTPDQAASSRTIYKAVDLIAEAVELGVIHKEGGSWWLGRRRR